MSTNPVFAIAQAKHDVLVSHLPHPTTGAVMPHQIPAEARLLALDSVFNPHLPHLTAPHAVGAVVQPRVHGPVQARRYVEVAKTEAFHDVMASAAHRGLDVAEQPITGPMEVSLAAKKTLYKKLLGF
ncbi:hypothetical protein GUITHDRAFT_152627 [Guillardia theta CCMP2712]|uniref:Uncharacterized protein n=1 Tax=Guillardia theta (strain CCMP2712) TaxID=905079 RepID=L1JBP5_GUITC|nr:hypothetical protein GUITHDRAFT_152626 [Guillardia theta CCMP2712]XP_005832525.1 hypothetical protein GUITHDRAFT_152627 [Guillardia theta CCMP2712]EKX45544.1 hypothetical protein GUITHDRAFT_152626 [Guillardia theta CCMP2712]EKX45545.1 hypothetical protein GUITHDRAFT_152627 [Guillardia theta CCMP2712]|eukprot:XP_005832524.1 hypothetical protein GUITHDRAFT_152626 [Guillardia theta CCMP2712]